MMLPTKFICQAFIIFIICTQAWTTADKCYIRLPQIIQGLQSDISLLKNEGCNLKYAYPADIDNDTVVLDEGDDIYVFCPGDTNTCNSYSTAPGVVQYNGKEIDKSDGIITLTCKSGLDFEMNETTVDVSNFTCKKYGNILLRQEERNRKDCKCGLYFSIGYEVKDEFITTFDLCHDDFKASTVWAHDVIQPTRYSLDKSKFPQKIYTFNTGILFEGLNMTNIYEESTIFNTFLNIFGNRSTVTKYLSTEEIKRNRIVIGHLVRAIFKQYESESDSEYIYPNVLPMWETVRVNNWLAIRDFISFMSRIQKQPLDVWAGGLDVLKLEGKEIYLHNNNQVPVPKFFFNIVVDRIANLSIVLIVVNNPYATRQELENEYRVCDDKIDLPQKYFKNPNNVTLGYTYACQLCDFYNNNRKKLGLKSLMAFEDYGTFDIAKGF